MTGPVRDFALEVHFAKWEFAAKYNLTGSDAQSLHLDELLQMATPDDRASFEKLHLGYTETYGDPELREQIASTYDVIQADNILCFAGAEEAIYVAMRVMLDKSDHTIVITPNYQAAETLPLSICEVTGVPLDIDAGWALDLDRLEAAIRPNTRLISINFPNNPTGCIIPRKCLEAIVAMCRERGIWLFSDEVYRLIERDSAIRLPQVADIYERGVSLNVLSKSYGLPGLRIGWVACQDKALLGRFERYKHYLSICNSAPSERLGIIALKARARILARNRSIVSDNLDRLDRFFAEFPRLFDWRRPDGSCVAFIRYRGAEGAETFARRLVEEAGVLVLPSSIYRSDLGPVPENCVRFGFGKTNLEEGLSVLGNWLCRNGP